MPDIWAIIVSIIILMVIYGYISSKISDRKKKKLRKETVPEISDSIKTGINYNIHLSDGRKFENVVIVGSVESEDEAFSFAGYEGLLVFKQQNGKKVYLKKPSIRYIEES